MEIESECNVCLNKFDKNIKKVNCSCNYNCCTFCAKKFLLEKKTIEFCCMNCNKNWDRGFLIANFGNKFINNEYKIFLQNILFIKESKFMPETQLHIEKDIKLQKLKLETLNLENKYANLRQKKHKIIYNEHRLLEIEIQKLKDISHEKTKKLVTNLNNELDECQIKINKNKKDFNSIYVDYSKFNKLHLCCPNTKCNGFLNFFNKCELCNTQACNVCYEIKETGTESTFDNTNGTKGHVCNQDTLQSVKYITDELKSKPCPTCSIWISKISGCNDAFCTACNTKYNWDSLKIMNKTTNPHYLEYKSKKGENVDIKTDYCPNVLDDNYVNLLFGKIRQTNFGIEVINKPLFVEYIDSKVYKRLSFNNLLNKLMNLIYFHKFNNYSQNLSDFDINLYQRKLYMKNIISNKQFKFEIHKTYKELEKKKDIHDIFIIFKESVIDILNEILIKVFKEKTCIYNIFTDAFKKIENLRIFTNKYFYDIKKKYNCKQWVIDIDYNLI